MSSPDTEFINILKASDLVDDSGARGSAKAMPDTLPILGLADVVIFPGLIVPLIVDTPEGAQLIDDVVQGDRFLGLVLQRSPDIDSPAPEDLYEYGCAGRVTKMLKTTDDTVRVLVEGVRRFGIVDYPSRKPYLKAKVNYLSGNVGESVELTALTRNARKAFEEVVELSPGLSESVKETAENTDDPSRLSDLIAANLNLGLDERQELLAANDVVERLNRLLPLLHREREVLLLGSKIQKDVAGVMSQTQREHFLREQIRAIQRELGESDPAADEANELLSQIEKNELPPEIAGVARKELNRLQQTPPSSGEHAIIRNYLDWIVHLPWNTTTEDRIELDEAARILDAGHHGLAKIKDRLLEFLAVIQLHRSLKGPLLCLVGPPGVGKTSLGKSVAEALGRKFLRISLGGVRDEAEIRGHRRTYLGAMPGRIIQGLRKVGSANPVILLDELDKVGADSRGDPAAALMEALDPQQNPTFTDHYLDLPFNLSRVMFIATANWLDPIHPALRDRLEVIELPSYTTTEKIQIAKRHLVPRQLAEHGLRKSQARIQDAALKGIIELYTREAGCRQLDREIASVARKAARDIAGGRKGRKPFNVSGASLRKLLGPPRFESETAGRVTQCGIAIGLAWTPVGGEILFIEATKMPGRGKLILTGSLGEIMKESAQTALSYLRSNADDIGVDSAVFENNDIHVHVPAGATPKDGPSAGVAIVMALTSLLTGRRVRSDLAMTGEISLRGRVLPVGGVKEKLLAAARAGVKRVILPERNRKDWDEAPPEVRDRIDVSFARLISDLNPLAILKR